jgi:hypothetical protein
MKVHLRSLTIITLAFIISVVIRWPQMHRPLSKHHDFTTAVVLMSIEAWKQMGGAEKASFTPLMSYTGNADRLLEKGVHTTGDGVQLYLSLGPGWYALPYCIFKLLQIPPSAFGLRMISLCFQFFSLIALYFLCYLLKPNNTAFHLFTGVFFLFAPSFAWYMGAGYIHNALMLPFALCLIMVAYKIFNSTQKIPWVLILLFFILGVVTIYFDWFGVFLLLCIFGYSILQVKKNFTYLFTALTSLLSILTGIGIIFFQFASFTGYEKIKTYWFHRSNNQGITNSDTTLLNKLANIGEHTATSYLPLILLFVCISFFVKNRYKLNFLFFTKVPVLTLWLTACFLYNILFLNWTAVHDFSIIPIGILLVIASAYLLSLTHNEALKKLMFYTTIILCVVQYFFINRPGASSQNGDKYDAYQKAGFTISKNIPVNTRIFLNLNNQRIIEYYAKRTFTHANTPGEAIKICRNFSIKKAVWVKIVNLEVKEIIAIPNH